MAIECNTRTVLQLIEQMGWKLAPCPHLRWLDTLGHHVIVTLQSEHGFSAFEIKYDPEEKEFTYFRASDPLRGTLLDV